MFEINLKMGEKLREKRGRKNLTIQKASDEIGISRRTLRDIENGKKKYLSKTVYKKVTDWLLIEANKDLN